MTVNYLLTTDQAKEFGTPWIFKPACCSQEEIYTQPPNPCSRPQSRQAVPSTGQIQFDSCSPDHNLQEAFKSLLTDQPRGTLLAPAACYCLGCSPVDLFGGIWHCFFQAPYHNKAYHQGVQTICPCTMMKS